MTGFITFESMLKRIQRFKILHKFVINKEYELQVYTEFNCLLNIAQLVIYIMGELYIQA